MTTDMVHVAEDPFLKSNQKAKAAPTCQAWGALPHSSAQEGTCRPQRGLRLVQHSSRLPSPLTPMAASPQTEPSMGRAQGTLPRRVPASAHLRACYPRAHLGPGSCMPQDDVHAGVRLLQTGETAGVCQAALEGGAPGISQCVRTSPSTCPSRAPCAKHSHTQEQDAPTPTPRAAGAPVPSPREQVAGSASG